MNEEPKDYELPVCPYCNKEAECEHLFATYDALDNYIMDGYLIDKMEPLIAKVREYFGKHLSGQEVKEDIFEPQDGLFDECWSNILQNIEYYVSRNEAYDMESVVNGYDATRLVISALTIDPVKAYEPMGPFLGYTYSYYTDEDHEEYYKMMLEIRIEDFLGIHKIR